MARSIQPARLRGASGDSTFPVRHIAYADGQTFKKFAVVIRNASGTIEEDTTDPTGIVGVTLQGAATGHGYGVPNEDDTVVFTGREQKVCVALAVPTVEFIGRIVDGSDEDVTVSDALVGDEYGVKKVGDDWVVDSTDTTNVCVEITDIDEERDLVYFIFLAADVSA